MKTTKERKKMLQLKDNYNGKRILLGLSGGPDSVCLFHLLLNSNATLYVAHVNHSLRDVADEEAQFVENLCLSASVPFYSIKADVEGRALELSMPVEEAGRKIRYEFFSKLCKELNIDYIATAHHMNDNAESILMHIIRGCGLSGLCGIRKQSGNIIRPLLDYTKKEILEYCNENNLKYCIDQTNLESDHTRTALRNIIIPSIEEHVNPRFVHTLSNATASYIEDCDFLSSLSNEAYSNLIRDGILQLNSYRKTPSPVAKRVLYRYISEKCHMDTDVYSAYIDSIHTLIMQNKTGKSISLPDGYTFATSYDSGIIKHQAFAQDYEYEIEIGKPLVIPEAKLQITIEESNGNIGINIPQGSRLTIRNRRNGDSFYPAGMTGKKKLKDYFIDIKLDRALRDKVPLLTINGEVAYICGYRADKRFLTEHNYIIKTTAI